jgi:arylformamidase
MNILTESHGHVATGPRRRSGTRGSGVCRQATGTSQTAPSNIGFYRLSDRENRRSWPREWFSVSGRDGVALVAIVPAVQALPELDEAYVPGRSIDPGPFIAEYAARSALARRELPWRAFPYGTNDSERLHFFPATTAGAPLLVFVHGGYWQELTEADSSFAAADTLKQGCAFAAMGYGLAPTYRLDEITAMVRKGVRWLYDNAAELGIDAHRIVLVGHSAGAQLAAMSLDVAPVRAAVLLSGLYDLKPLLRTSIGPAIRLTADEAERNSPVTTLRHGMPPLLAAYGADETAGFAVQQELLVAAANEAGVPVDTVVVHRRNHFDLPLGLADPADPLGQRVLAVLH